MEMYSKSDALKAFPWLENYSWVEWLIPAIFPRVAHIDDRPQLSAPELINCAVMAELGKFGYHQVGCPDVNMVLRRTGGFQTHEGRHKYERYPYEDYHYWVIATIQSFPWRGVRQYVITWVPQLEVQAPGEYLAKDEFNEATWAMVYVRPFYEIARKKLGLDLLYRKFSLKRSEKHLDAIGRPA